MGRYYALHDGEDAAVADAIRDHYAPRGRATPCRPIRSASPSRWPISLTCSLPSSPSARSRQARVTPTHCAVLPRIIRIIRENGLRLPLRRLIEAAAAPLDAQPDADEVLAFLAERLRVQLRVEGARHDVLAAVLGTGLDDDFARVLVRTDAVAAFLATDDGANLLTAYRRAANILRIEEKRTARTTAPSIPRCCTCRKRSTSPGHSTAWNRISRARSGRGLRCRHGWPGSFAPSLGWLF